MRGDFEIKTNTSLSCNSLNSLYENGVMLGNYSCSTATDSANSTTLHQTSNPRNNSTSSGSNGASLGSSGSSGSSVSSGSPSSGLSSGGKAGIGVGVGLGGALLLGGAIGLFVRRRRKTLKGPSAEHIAEKDGSGMERANMLGNDGQKHELEQPLGEMPVGKEAHELPAKHGSVEVGRNASTKGPAGIESRHEMPANEEPAETKMDGGEESKDLEAETSDQRDTVREPKEPRNDHRT